MHPYLGLALTQHGPPCSMADGGLAAKRILTLTWFFILHIQLSASQRQSGAADRWRAMEANAIDCVTRRRTCQRERASPRRALDQAWGPMPAVPNPVSGGDNECPEDGRRPLSGTTHTKEQVPPRPPTCSPQVGRGAAHRSQQQGGTRPRAALGHTSPESVRRWQWLG